MLRLLSFLFGLLMVAAVGGVAAVLLAVDEHPLVGHEAPPSRAEQRWTAALLETGGALGDLASITLSEREVGVVTNQLLPRVLARAWPAMDGDDARAHVDLGPGTAELSLSLPSPMTATGWLNLHATVIETPDLPKLTGLRAGRLPLPAGLAREALAPTLASVGRMGMVQRVSFAPGQVRLDFGGGDAADDLDLQLIRAAQVRLAALIAQTPRGKLDLAVLLSALVGGADSPVGPEDGAEGGAPPGAEDGAPDPVAANRAAIVALAGYVLTGRLPAAASRAAGVTATGVRRVQLRGRDDLAKHYMASAAMAVGGGAGLSGLIGLAKEFDDAERGSGFSFADLAANRAGIRFAKLATADPATARKVQRLAAAGLDQAALMPAIDGLPEGIRDGAFARDYAGANAPVYRGLVEHIDRRIDALRLFRSATGLGSGLGSAAGSGAADGLGG